VTSWTTANPSTILLYCRRLREWWEDLRADAADGTLTRGPAAALSPAKVLSVQLVEGQDRGVRVIVPDSQLSLAIGREGQNVRLAAKLTTCHIDIESESHTRDTALAAQAPDDTALTAQATD
jgi:hypothetical protein